ncbi:MAG: 30S ribosomal protein S14 [Defluviicoccus sp.]|nr:30S ribosomal protein S14 [Defluviicoccus sp.]MDE0383798.1 30S ribosomal protein S14 [Defluviicoccus sp.]
MAKKSAVERNSKRRRLAARDSAKRAALKEIANDRDLPMEERFSARLRLAKMPRNGAAVRVRNRCELSGRPRGYYRKFRISRIALRELAAFGLIPGMVKSSW